MERALVADFYRGKGYVVHESFLVTGQSGNQQRVPLLAEGPLGNLAVFFGDAAGIDGHEIGAAKRVAKDLRATAVVAAGTFSPDHRRAAAELGVVLLDAASLGAAAVMPAASAWPGQTPGATLERDLNAHPWPSSGRPGGIDGPAQTGTYDVDEVIQRFERAKAAPPPMASAAPAPSTTLESTGAVGARPPDGGLWRHARPMPAPATPRAPTAAPRAAGAFAWLDLPQSAQPEPEVEYAGTVSARAGAPPVTAMTPEELQAQRDAKLMRDIQLRQLVRRGAWILGGAVFVYLFLLWWL